MNTVLNDILYNNLNASLMKHHNPEIIDIKEHVCGENRPIEQTRRLYRELSVLKKDIAESLSMEHDIHECIMDNGNIMFTVKMYHNGVPFISVPFKKDGQDEPHFVIPQNIMQPSGPNMVLPASEISSTLDKNIDTDSEEFKGTKEMFRVLKNIDYDTPIRYLNKETYMNHISKHVKEDELPPSTLTDDSGVGMAIVQRDGNFSTLRYTSAVGKMNMSPLNTDDGSEILLCINENFRSFDVFDQDFIEDSDIMESFFICNKNAVSRHIPDLAISEAVEREDDKAEDDKIRKGVKASRISNASPLSEDNPAYEAVPKKAGVKLKGFANAARSLIAKVKRANDDQLREKLYRDEFIPLFDDFFEFVCSGTVTAAAFAVVNPILAILMGILTFMVMNWKQQIDRRRVKEILAEKIAALEEEIEDARSDGDLAKKRKLSEVKRILERKQAKLAVGKTIAAR